jgi:hypothetical protein
VVFQVYVISTAHQPMHQSNILFPFDQAAELRQCVLLEELSLENNKLVRPLLDFRSMPKLRVLRLFGNPLEFLPEILPLHNLRHLTLANIRIEALESLRSVTVQIEVGKLSCIVILLARLFHY